MHVTDYDLDTKSKTLSTMAQAQMWVIAECSNTRASPANLMVLQGHMRYLVVWKSYEKKADRTWQTEEDLE